MRVLLAGLVAGLVIGYGSDARANEASAAKAREALAVCMQIETTAGGEQLEKLDRLARGVTFAEEAVHADDADPKAHFALFCNLGKQLELAGLSWRSLGRLHRMQAELDRTLALDPDYADALVSKGELLRRIPGPLGGDKVRALELFHRALQIAPDSLSARLYLARAMREDGAPAPEARAEAEAALALAQKMGAAREASEAQQLLASLDH